MTVDSFKALKNAKLIYDGGLLQLTELHSPLPDRKPMLLIKFSWNVFQCLFGLGCKCGAAVCHAVLGPMYLTRTAPYGSWVSLCLCSVVVKCLTDILLCEVSFDDEVVS